MCSHEFHAAFSSFSLSVLPFEFGKVVRAYDLRDAVCTVTTIETRSSAFDVHRVGNADDIVEKHTIEIRLSQSGSFLRGFVGTHLNIVATGSNSTGLV